MSGAEVTRNAQALIVIGKAWNDCTPQELEKIAAYKRALQDKKRKPAQKTARNSKLSARKFIAPSHGRADSLHTRCCCCCC